MTKPYQGNVPSVCPSGRGIYFPFDKAVTDIFPSGEKQSLTISVKPVDLSISSFTLTYNGQTTSSIPITVGSPPVYCTYNKTITSAGTFTIQVNSLNSDMFYEIYDNNTKVGTFRLSGSLPSPYQDPTLLRNDGAPVQWYSIGSYTFSSTNVKVRISSDVFIVANCLRIATADNSTFYVVDNSTTTFIAPSISGSPFWQVVTVNEAIAGKAPVEACPGVWSGDQYHISNTAVQTSLEALSNIGTNNVVCTGDGSVSANGAYANNPLLIQFQNALDNLSLNLITATSTSSAVQVQRVASGGSWPRIKINGGSPIALNYPLCSIGGQSSVYFPLLADAPDVKYAESGTYENTLPGGGSTWLPSYYYYSNDPYFHLPSHADIYSVSRTQGSTATYVENPLRPGTYRISAFWPPESTLSNDVVFTVTNVVGTVLGTYHVNQSIAPSGSDGWQVLASFTITAEYGDGLIVTQSNNTSSPMIADTIRFERTSSRIDIVINPGDTVTYSNLAGWCSTADGPVSAGTNQTILNLSGYTNTLFPSVPSGSQSMRIGYNLDRGGSSFGSLIYGNILHMTDGLSAAEVNNDGYPTKSSTQTGSVAIHQGTSSHLGNGKFWPTIPPGDYFIMWDGDSVLTLFCQAPSDSATEQVNRRVITGTTDNIKYYTLATNGPNPTVTLGYYYTSTEAQNIDNTYNIHATNIRIYPASADPSNPPRWHPQFLTHMQNTKTLRGLDWLQGAGNAAEYNDFIHDNLSLNNLKVASELRQSTAKIARIEQYTGNIPIFPHKVPFLFTTVNPHGMYTGQQIQIQNYTGPAAQLTGPNGANTNFDLNYLVDYILVISPTQFIQPGGGVLYDTMTNVITNPPGDIVVPIFCGNLADLVDLCNINGANLHLNTPWSITDDALYRIGIYLAQNLNPGLLVYHEISNEIWNTGVAPFRFALFGGTAYAGGGGQQDCTIYQVFRSKHDWDMIESGMATLGRGSGSLLRRMLGSSFGNPGQTAQLAASVVAQGVNFHVLTIAPYFHCAGYNGTPGGVLNENIINMLNNDQVLDLHEILWMHTNYENSVADHKAAMLGHMTQSQVNAIEVEFYEGGPENPAPQNNTVASVRYGERAHKISYHPRYWKFLLNAFKIFNDQGVTQMNVYRYGGFDSTVDSGRTPQIWSSFNGSDQDLYLTPGNPTQDNLQITNLGRLDQLQSVQGGAISAWAAMTNNSVITYPSYHDTANLNSHTFFVSTTGHYYSPTVIPPTTVGYQLSAGNSYISLGDSIRIFATLNQGVTLTSPLVITVQSQLDPALTGTITINVGQTSGSVLLKPNATVGQPTIYVHHITGSSDGGNTLDVGVDTSFMVLASIVDHDINDSNAFYVLSLGIKFDGATGHYIRF